MTRATNTLLCLGGVALLLIPVLIGYAIWRDVAHPCIRTEPVQPYVVTTCSTVGQVVVCNSDLVTERCVERAP